MTKPKRREIGVGIFIVRCTKMLLSARLKPYGYT
jgi:hypothetical protein